SQLPAHTVSGVIDQRIFQKWLADAVDPSGKAFQGKWDIVGLFFTRLAISNAGFSVGRARLSDKNPDADTCGVLLFQQIRQIIVCSVGDGNGAHGNSSHT